MSLNINISLVCWVHPWLMGCSMPAARTGSRGGGLPGSGRRRAPKAAPLGSRGGVLGGRLPGSPQAFTVSFGGPRRDATTKCHLGQEGPAVVHLRVRILGCIGRCRQLHVDRALGAESSLVSMLEQHVAWRCYVWVG